MLGLQDIHRNLDEDQLQSYLLEAGALGSSEFTMMNKMVSQKKPRFIKGWKTQYSINSLMN